jgi:hypothetical protein
MESRVRAIAIPLLVGLSASWTVRADAQPEDSARGTAQVVAPPPRETATIYESRPNSALMTTGLFTLGLPYVTSVVVATSSSRSGDNNLYIPVAGPWLDLGNRGECVATPTSPCSNETTNKALLIGDGVLQGLGALEIVSAFLFPERHAITVTAGSHRIVVAPARIAQGAYGISAAGAF